MDYRDAVGKRLVSEAGLFRSGPSLSHPDLTHKALLCYQEASALKGRWTKDCWLLNLLVQISPTSHSVCVSLSSSCHRSGIQGLPCFHAALPKGKDCGLFAFVPPEADTQRDLRKWNCRGPCNFTFGDKPVKQAEGEDSPKHKRMQRAMLWL